MATAQQNRMQSAVDEVHRMLRERIVLASAGDLIESLLASYEACELLNIEKDIADCCLVDDPLRTLEEYVANAHRADVLAMVEYLFGDQANKDKDPNDAIFEWVDDDPENARELLDYIGEEIQLNEALCYYIINDDWSDRLREVGEPVGEVLGLTIWGRTTAGQAVEMDGCIHQIAHRMGILPGQRNQWVALPLEDGTALADCRIAAWWESIKDDRLCGPGAARYWARWGDSEPAFGDNLAEAITRLHKRFSGDASDLHEPQSVGLPN